MARSTIWRVLVLFVVFVASCGDEVTAPDASSDPGVAADQGAALFSDGSGGGTAALSSGGATVTTDKDDYQPGDTVTISGAGWWPGETVDLRITEDPPVHEDGYHFEVVADDDGG